LKAIFLSISLRNKLRKIILEKNLKKYGYEVYPGWQKLEVLLLHNPRVKISTS